MKKTAAISSIIGISVLLCSCGAEKQNPYASLYEDLPFEMDVIQAPVIPSYSVCITDFGGKGDVMTDNTNAFCDAIEHLAAKGGGHLNVPKGIWSTGPIELKSNIDLHLERDAVISFIPDPELYPMIKTIYEGLDVIRCESPIHADHAKNFSITGEGVFDGNGNAWRGLSKDKMCKWYWKMFNKKGGILNKEEDTLYQGEDFFAANELGITTRQKEFLDDETAGKVKRIFRPVMLSLRYCEGFMLNGCRYQNTPAWCLHFIVCKDFIVDGVDVYNPIYASNGDGIDIDSCEGAILVNSRFDAGDDGICIKSGRDKDGRERGIPTQKLIIDNCTVVHGHGGFVVGSEMSGGVRDIKVTSCRFLGTDKGLRFKSTRGRGGEVKNIWVDGIIMKDIIEEAVLFNMYYARKDDGNVTAVPVDETTPIFKDIHISNIWSEGSYKSIFMYGLPEMPLENIDFTNCHISSFKGLEIDWCKNVSFKNLQLTCKEGEERTVNNSTNITFK